MDLLTRGFSSPAWRTAAGFALPLSALVTGCLPTAARPGLATGPDSAAPRAAAQQAGAVNAAAQTAIEYHTDLPWKAVLLLIGYAGLEAGKQTVIVTLSHRREMRRLQREVC